jgi:hypothetical protein
MNSIRSLTKIETCYTRQESQKIKSIFYQITKDLINSLRHVYMGQKSMEKLCNKSCT